MCVNKKRAHEVMKWRQALVQTEKQEVEREAVEAKIEEHLKVLEYKNIFNCMSLHDQYVVATNYKVRSVGNRKSCIKNHVYDRYHCVHGMRSQ